MKLRIVLPVIYLIAVGFFVLGPLGRAGHGPGPAVAYYLSMPSILLFTYIFKRVPFMLFWIPLAGVIQYALLGYLIDRFLTRGRKRPVTSHR